MANPYDLLRAELGRESARPFITFYDDATGERVELSVTTFDNWVAKTAGLLRDGLSAAPGDRVALLLPAHWQALVWASASWAVGTITAIEGDASAEVAVAGPDTLELAAGASEIVALSMRPLGGRFAEPLPPGMLDYAVEVSSYPDRLAPYVPARDDDPALEVGGRVHSHDSLIRQARERADQLGVTPGGRLLVPTDELTVAIRDALLTPLVIGGSAVLIRNEDSAQRAARVAAERVTHIAA